MSNDWNGTAHPHSRHVVLVNNFFATVQMSYSADALHSV